MPFKATYLSGNTGLNKIIVVMVFDKQTCLIVD